MAPRPQRERSRIMRKALATPLLLLIFLLGTGLFSADVLERLELRLRRVEQELTPGADAAQRVLCDLYRERLAVDGFLTRVEEQRAQLWQAQNLAVQDALTRARDTVADPDWLAQVDALQALHREYTEMFRSQVMRARLDIRELDREVLGPRGEAAAAQLTAAVQQAFARDESAFADIGGQTLRALLTAQVHMQRFVANQDASIGALARQRVAEVEALLQTLLALAYSDAVRMEVEDVLAHWAAIASAFDEMTRLHHESDQLIQGKLAELAARLTDDAETLQSLTFASIADMNARTHADTTATRWLLWTLLALSLLVGLGLTWAITRSYLRPIILLNEFMKRLSADLHRGNADLSQRVQVSGRDEAAELAASVNHFIATLADVTATLKREASGLEEAATGLSEATVRTGNDMQSQRSELDQAVTAMEQLATSIETVARYAADAAEGASVAYREAREGASTVAESVNALHMLVRTVGQARDAITQLSEDAVAIADIADTISAVAAQTNLLALNAAIEAARAGENGRGFAVVAGEVRDLAQRAGQAAGRIEAQIAELQQTMNAAVDTMADGVARGETAVQRAAAAGAAFERVTRAVSAIDSMNSQVARAAEEQSQASREVFARIENIRQLTEDTAIGAAHSAKASGELLSLSERLRALVGGLSESAARA